MCTITLTGVAQLERHPINRKVAGQIPGWGAYKKATSQCFCLTVMFLSLSLSLSVSSLRKSHGEMSSGED